MVIACELVVPPLEDRSLWLTILCGGARGLAEVQDDEIWISMQPEHLELTVNRMKRAGAKYPPAILSNANNITKPDSFANICSSEKNT
jgi:hypothetical protein